MSNHPTDQSEARARAQEVLARVIDKPGRRTFANIIRENGPDGRDRFTGDEVMAAMLAFAARPAGEAEDNGRDLTAGERSIIDAAHMRSVKVVGTMHPVGEVERLREALEAQMETQDVTLPSSMARKQGLVWLEGWFDLSATLQEPTR